MDYADELRKAGCVIPNLDCLSTEAAELFRRLHVYAKCKTSAMRLRKAGDVQSAMLEERAADAAYKRLPDWAKW
jgi:hypothetical protein